MYGHLVTIEVGIERRTYEWVQLDSLAFDQDRLECLNAESMQRRGTVQHDRVLANHFFKNIPDFRDLRAQQVAWPP